MLARMRADVPEGGGSGRSSSAASPPRPGGLGARVATVAGGTLVSRVLGLVRDRVIAGAFPAVATDAFFVAFTIPNALRGLVAEGATSAAVVPLAGEARRAGGDAAARAFVGRFFGVMAVGLFALALVGVATAPALVAAYAAGYLVGPEEAGRFPLTVTLTRLVFPYVALVGLAGVATGALHAQGRFRIASIAPAWLNVGLILAPVLFVGPVVAAGLPAVAGLAVGALAGGLAHLTTVVVAAWRTGALGPPVPRLGDPAVREGLRRLGPLVLGVGVYQANVLIGRLVASFLEVGAQSWLYYAQRLVELPQGLLALAVAAAALPGLSARHAERDGAGFGRGVTDAVGLTLFLAIPAAALLVVGAEPIVAVLFRVGAFGGGDVAATAAALRLQALGVVGVSLARTLVPAFHARGDTRTPVRASMANLAVFAPASVLLARGMGHPGVALASALAGWAQAALLVHQLLRGRDPVAIDARGLLARAGRTLVASAAAAVAAFGILAWGWEAAVGGGARGMVILITALGAAALVFFGLATLFRAPEVAALERLWRRR